MASNSWSSNDHIFQVGYKFDINNPVVRDDGLVRLAFKGIADRLALCKSGRGMILQSKVMHILT